MRAAHQLGPCVKLGPESWGLMDVKRSIVGEESRVERSTM